MFRTVILALSAVCVCAVPNMAVCCSSLISCFADMWFRYCLNDFEIVPVAPVITGIAFVFKIHIHHISTVITAYLKKIRLIITIILFWFHVCSVLLFFCYSAWAVCGVSVVSHLAVDSSL